MIDFNIFSQILNAISSLLLGFHTYKQRERNKEKERKRERDDVNVS